MWFQEACRFGNSCTRLQFCRYGHGVPCHFGSSCTRAGCTFTHYITNPAAQAAEAVDEISASLPSTPPKPGADTTNENEEKNDNEQEAEINDETSNSNLTTQDEAGGSDNDEFGFDV